MVCVCVQIIKNEILTKLCQHFFTLRKTKTKYSVLSVEDLNFTSQYVRDMVISVSNNQEVIKFQRVIIR